MLLDLLRGGDIFEIIVGLCVSAFVVFCIIPIHEYAHAFTAYKLGDETARLSGRLTLNPMAHFNPIGALMILLVGFGYAQPVPVNIRNVRMKNKKLAMVIIALAGPVSNLIMAFLSMLVMFILSAVQTSLVSTNSYIYYAFLIFFEYAAIININLAVFNLLPIPPLDGSRILFAVLPAKYYFGIMKYEKYIIIGIMVLLFTGILTKPLSFLTGLVYDMFYSFLLLFF